MWVFTVWSVMVRRWAMSAFDRPCAIRTPLHRDQLGVGQGAFIARLLPGAYGVTHRHGAQEHHRQYERLGEEPQGAGTTERGHRQSVLP